MDGGTALHHAVFYGNTAICQLLLKSGANISATDEYGNQPLHMAALLITNDTVNVVDRLGYHALHMASTSYNVVVVQQLVDCGADTNAVNIIGQTPLHTAAAGQKDCPELCEILLKHGSKTNTEDRHRNHPLHLACKQGHLETIKLMLSHGADANVMIFFGQTPLHIAAGWKDCPELCEILVKHDTEGNTAVEDGNQPLHVAVNEHTQRL